MSFSAKDTVAQVRRASAKVLSGVADVAADKLADVKITENTQVKKVTSAVQGVVHSAKDAVDRHRNGPSLAYRAGDFVGSKLRDAGVDIPAVLGAAPHTPQSTSTDDDVIDTYVIDVDDKR